MVGSSNDSSPDPAIWLCPQVHASIATAPDWLINTEIHTAARLSGPRRQEYLSSRWLIRQAISGASGRPPDSCRPVSGRPVATQSPPGWTLSLSHSHGLCACATSSGGALGLDIEPARRHPQWQKVVKRWFTSGEQSWLLESDDPTLFLMVWTLKEAWLKATGRGIAGNLKTLEVSSDFRLRGDRPETDWYASCCRADGFLVTLVFRAEHPDTAPVIHRFPGPPADLGLASGKPVKENAEPLLFCRIHPCHPLKE